MITIKTNQVNLVALTLNEKQTLAQADWLFVFTNDMTGQQKIFTSSDISPATSRYNLFTITDSTIENPYAGTMYFTPVGYWSYTIYEMNISSPVDLDPLNAVSIVETGKVLVNGPDTTTASFDVDNTINNKAFDY